MITARQNILSRTILETKMNQARGSRPQSVRSPTHKPNSPESAQRLEMRRQVRSMPRFADTAMGCKLVNASPRRWDQLVMLGDSRNSSRPAEHDKPVPGPRTPCSNYLAPRLESGCMALVPDLLIVVINVSPSRKVDPSPRSKRLWHIPACTKTKEIAGGSASTLQALPPC